MYFNFMINSPSALLQQINLQNSSAQNTNSLENTEEIHSDAMFANILNNLFVSELEIDSDGNASIIQKSDFNPIENFPLLLNEIDTIEEIELTQNQEIIPALDTNLDSQSLDSNSISNKFIDQDILIALNTTISAPNDIAEDILFIDSKLGDIKIFDENALESEENASNLNEKANVALMQENPFTAISQNLLNNESVNNDLDVTSLSISAKTSDSKVSDSKISDYIAPKEVQLIYPIHDKENLNLSSNNDPQLKQASMTFEDLEASIPNITSNEDVMHKIELALNDVKTNMGLKNIDQPTAKQELEVSEIEINEFSKIINESLNAPKHDINSIEIVKNIAKPKEINDITLDRVAFEVVKHYTKNNENLKFHLNPKELGSIEISFEKNTITGDGKVSIFADRYQTLDMLTKIQHDIEKIFSTSKAFGNDVSLEFGMSEQNRNMAQHVKELFNSDTSSKGEIFLANADDSKAVRDGYFSFNKKLDILV